MRRGVVGALASGDARVRRACGAVRKGARAEAGWCRAPHARAEGFMGVRLRTFFKGDSKKSPFCRVATVETRQRQGRRKICRVDLSRQMNSTVATRQNGDFLESP